MRSASSPALAARVIVAACCVVVSVTQSGCGGDSSPQNPTPVVSTRSIAVTVNGPLLIGDTQQATATATMSDGTTRSLTTGFRSDVPSVAMVTDAGMVTAVGAGRANIYLVSDGQQGTANIQVTPNFGGSWSGSYITNSCTQSGEFEAAEMCELFPVNQVLPYNMYLGQSRSDVTGSFYMGSIPFEGVSGQVNGAGELALSGTYVDEELTVSVSWNLTSPVAGRLNGSLRHVWRVSGVSGEMVVTGTIRDSMRSVAAPRVPTGVSEALQRWRQRIRR